ncbi:TonB-dependent receptor plug domain-containing protein [Pseudoxanthomonas sacheonensis]|uniref:TonB-dependent receptor plug domain-containing protein n=1 Tax=Pseudoxanthomonas sacheonensis TaxID=443615 RepID=UPI0013D1DBE6|nr:TonB-dependent receptor [Pseudoxanthomonas sacheonensis]KAF1707626.1 TonB-dependent receptor [Pseudoxanthomonas sacheonensis]
MKKNLLAAGLSHALACAAFASFTATALAQTATQTPDGASEAKQLDTIVVQGEITYRNRSDDTAPVLSYDLEYFQRFEPSTVGDMLKRLPGVTFVGSDIMEFDGVMMRGMAAGYTQVLINGKKMPGAGDDRSFWVDRIPAEMVDHIEILRSTSANRSGDAIAGAINIVLRDAYAFDGSYLRLGLNRWYDGEVNPTFGAVTSGEALGGRLLAGINVQDRYRAKVKRSDRFGDPSMEELVSFEDQTEVKDGRDYSANLSYTADVGETGRFSIDGFYVKTDRDVKEVSHEIEFDDEDVIEANVPGFNPIDQKNWGIGAEYRFDMAGGTTEFDLDYAKFEDNSAEREESHEYVNGEWDASEAEASAVQADDTETSFKIAHKRPVGGAELEFGADYRKKKRDVVYTNYEWEAEEEGDPVVYELDGTVGSLIEETRVDPYVMLTGKGEVFSWEAGLRYETTKSDIRYSEDDEVEGTASNDYNELLPSLHLKWDLTDADRISLSLAKSVKRPNFNELIPAVLDGEFGDNDYVGNPLLDPETANGIDLGFEHRLGKHGVIGVNFFYRDVKNLIELVNTGELSEDAQDTYEEELEEFLEENPGSTEDDFEFDPESWLFTSANVGDGKVYGVEFDLSTPLTALGMPNTGVFLNYSYLNSKVTDFIGERRFNDQARSVYNIGFIQDLPSWAASFGATYRKQGDAFSRILAEEVTVKYGDDLEVFVEKRFGKTLSVRLSAANLLDASKDEYFHKFDNEADQIDRDYDEYELESEEAGPSYQLVMRWAF